MAPSGTDVLLSSILKKPTSREYLFWRKNLCNKIYSIISPPIETGCFGNTTDISSSAEKAWQLEEVLKERIVIIDGAMGTMIQVGN